MSFQDVAPWAGLVLALLVVLWLVVSLGAAVVVALSRGGDDGVVYTTVYLIERSLSLDNLFVFLVLFVYFGVPYRDRGRLLFAGIVGALVLRAAFIVAGVALIDRFHFLLYLLGAGLLLLAARLLR